ncbi:MAG TPA: hypothetical protein VJ741_02890 [Solirubrobacteraceae bacterium]|nr:hypothetical protein [Solirubrobacteraceae bacterium]
MNRNLVVADVPRRSRAVIRRVWDPVLAGLIRLPEATFRLLVPGPTSVPRQLAIPAPLWQENLMRSFVPDGWRAAFGLLIVIRGGACAASAGCDPVAALAVTAMTVTAIPKHTRAHEWRA